MRKDVEVRCVAGDEARPCDGGGMEDYANPHELVTGPGPCRGDSGGGLYENATVDGRAPVVVGVISRGHDNDKICDEGVHVRVDGFKDFIAETGGIAAKEGSYSPPTWAKAVVEVVDDGGVPATASEVPSTTSSCAAGAVSSTSPFGAALVLLLLAALAFRREQRSSAERC